VLRTLHKPFGRLDRARELAVDVVDLEVRAAALDQRYEVVGREVVNVVDERAVLGGVFPLHVVVLLDGVWLVGLDREPRVHNERRELLPLHRAVAVDVDLREELAKVRDEL